MTVKSPRLAALDNFRAGLALLGIPFHTVVFVALSTEPDAVGMTISLVELTQALSSGAAQLVRGLFYIHSFWMPGFFLLSGLVARLICARKGLSGFVHNRLLKIAIPFGFCWGWKVPFYIGVAWWQPSAHQGPWWLALTDLGDTWFLYYLLWLDALTIGLVYTAARWSWLKALTARLDRLVLQGFATNGRYLVISALCTVLLLNQPFIGYRALDVSLYPAIGLVSFYGVWYGLGWWLYGKQPWFNRFFRGGAGKVLLSALLYAAFVGGYAYTLPQANGWQKTALLGLYQGSLSLMVLALFGLVWRYGNRYYAVLRYISGASYWLYLSQLVIIIALIQTGVGGTNFYSRCATIIVLAFAIAFIGYQGLVRHTWLNRYIGQTPSR